MKENKSNSICQSCGNPFPCGAGQGECWCFELYLSPEITAKLKEDFKDCLCRDCLKEMIKMEAAASASNNS